jgi:hypothetical protein
MFGLGGIISGELFKDGRGLAIDLLSFAAPLLEQLAQPNKAVGQEPVVIRSTRIRSSDLPKKLDGAAEEALTLLVPVCAVQQKSSAQ